MGILTKPITTLTAGTRELATDGASTAASIITTGVSTSASLVSGTFGVIVGMFKSMVDDVKSFADEHPIAALAVVGAIALNFLR